MSAIGPILASKAFQGAMAAVAAAGTAKSLHDQHQAQKSQEKADKAAQAAAAISNQRKIRQQIVAARVARANALVAGGSQGGFQDSAVQGATGSIQAQLGSNIGAMNTQIGAGNAINSLTNQARGQLSSAQTFGTIAALPSAFGFDMQSIFKEQTKKQPGIE